MDKKYSFKFDDIKFPKIIFQVNDNWEMPKGKVPLKTNIDIVYHLDKRELSVVVRLQSQEHKHTPFTFLIEGVGLFVFEKQITKKSAERIAHVNCAAILFPYIREVASDIIRRAGFPPYHHHPVNFQAYYEDRIKKEAQKTVQRKKKTQKTITRRKKQTASKRKTA